MMMMCVCVCEDEDDVDDDGGVCVCLSRDVRLLILEAERWSVVQKHQAVVEGISVDELMEFVCSFKAELYAEGLVQGNLTRTVYKTHPSRGALIG